MRTARDGVAEGDVDLVSGRSGWPASPRTEGPIQADRRHGVKTAPREPGLPTSGDAHAIGWHYLQARCPSVPLLALLAALVAAAPARPTSSAERMADRRSPTTSASRRTRRRSRRPPGAWNTSGADVRLKEVARPRRAPADRRRRRGRDLGRGVGRLRRAAGPVLHDGRGDPDQRQHPLRGPRPRARQGPAPRALRLQRADGAAPRGASELDHAWTRSEMAIRPPEFGHVLGSATPRTCAVMS